MLIYPRDKDETFTNPEVGTTPSARVQFCTIPEEKWDAMRAIISQLYLSPGWTLPKVMKYLDKKHEFRAT